MVSGKIAMLVIISNKNKRLGVNNQGSNSTLLLTVTPNGTAVGT